MRAKVPWTRSWAEGCLAFWGINKENWSDQQQHKLLMAAWKGEQKDKKPRRCNVCGHYGVIK